MPGLRTVVAGNRPKRSLEEKIGYGEQISYGVGGLAYNLSFESTNVFMLYFYTDFLGIRALTAGTMLFISKILDAVFTVLMGMLLDKTKSRHGKGRAWILGLTIPHSVAIVLAFFVPSLGPNGKVVYAFLTYNLLMTVAWSGINLAYGILGTRMTRDQAKRANLAILRTVGALIGTVVVNVATLPLVRVFGNRGQAWALAMMVYALVAAVLFLLTFFLTRERITETSETTRTADIPVKDSIRSMLKNKYAVMLMLLFTANFLIQGLQSVFIYYCTYFLMNPKLVGTRSLFGLLSMALVLTVLGPLSKRFGKRNVSFIGTLVQLMGALMLIVNPHSIGLALISFAVTMMGFAPFTGVKFAMVSDVIEYGAWKTGIRNEGMIFGAVTVGQKIGTGIGTALTGWVLAMAHYVPNARVEPQSAMSAILWLVVGIPVIVSGIQAMVLWKYKLDDEYNSIVQT